MTFQRKTRNLTDLAEKAGVTAATASMALRNSPRLSDAVKDRIRQIAEEDGFTPRSYTRRIAAAAGKRFSHLKPVLFLDNSVDEQDPIGAALLAVLGPMMNRYGVEFQMLNQRELADNPDVLEEIGAVFVYNDPAMLNRISAEIPAVQVFGWEPMRKNTDRITANDEEIVTLAIDHLRRAKVERSAIFWRDDMIKTGPHPRIVRFVERMNALGIDTVEFKFGKFDTDFTERLRAYIAAGSDRVGFFGFNARCGVKLCCGLDSLGLFQKYSPNSLVVCDNSVMLKDFWPNPAIIDLDLPLMTRRALEMLFLRMENPGIPEALVLQSPRPLNETTH